jgi:hypothetical protein
MFCFIYKKINSQNNVREFLNFSIIPSILLTFQHTHINLNLAHTACKGEFLFSE